jgi:hypothetical protein
VLDLNALYLEWRKNAPLEVMPRQGIHWSYSSLERAIGAFVPWAEEQIGADLAEWTWESSPVTDRALFADRDLLDLLNLRWEPEFDDRYGYPHFKLVEEPDSPRKQRPRLITIGDSFFWHLRGQNIDGQLFDQNSPFIYYFKTVYVRGQQPTPLLEYDLKAALDSTDVVMLLGSEGTMRRFPYGLEDVVDELIQ